MSYTIGVDIGGTNIVAALISPEGKILERALVATHAKKGKVAVLKSIKNAIGLVMNKDVVGVGVGCPGPLDPFKGIIKTPVNIPLKNTRLRDILEREFDVPVSVDNDANCFVLGESVFGDAKKSSLVVGLTLGTGIGGGIVLNQEIVHGAGNAGELGIVSIKFDGLKGKHGNPGEIEEYISIRGIMSLAKGLKVKEPLDIYNLAKNGNKKAIKVFEKFGSYLGIAITNFICALDPDAVVIGGNISNAKKFFEKSMKKEIKKRAPFNNAKIYMTANTEKYAVLGAAYLVSEVSRIKNDIFKTDKPWGNFLQYALNKRCTVKILTVKRNQVLSLQSHESRNELWIALDEGLKAEIGNQVFYPKVGDQLIIPRRTKHRLSSVGKTGRMLEVSFGFFDEKDIIRFEDKYGRV